MDRWKPTVGGRVALRRHTSASCPLYPLSISLARLRPRPSFLPFATTQYLPRLLLERYSRKLTGH